MPPRKKEGRSAAAPNVMFGAMDVSTKPPTQRSGTAPEEIRKVQSTGNLRGGDGATVDAAPPVAGAVAADPPAAQPGTANANGYTSDTAVPTTSAAAARQQRTTAPMRGARSSLGKCVGLVLVSLGPVHGSRHGF